MYKFAYSVLLAFVLLSAQSFAKAYKLVDPAGMSEEPEVIEFFSYTCPVCYRLEQPLTGWKKGRDKSINFKRVPMFKPLLTKAFFTAEYLKVEDKIHSMIFHRIHAEKKNIVNKADLKKLFVEAGVEEKAFEKAFKSFHVRSQAKKAEKLALKFRVSSVPTFIVNNKYETSLVLAESNKTLFDTLSTLPLQGR